MGYKNYRRVQNKIKLFSKIKTNKLFDTNYYKIILDKTNTFNYLNSLKLI